MILHTNDNVYPTEADAEILGKEVQIIHRLFLVIYYLPHGNIWAKQKQKQVFTIYVGDLVIH